MYHFCFKATGSDDAGWPYSQKPGVTRGQSLALWLSEQLVARKFEVSEIWREGQAWDFWVSKGTFRYLCACSVAGDLNAPHEGHVTLNKQQSFWQWLTGRHKYTSEDTVVEAVRSALESSAGMAGLVEEV